MSGVGGVGAFGYQLPAVFRPVVGDGRWFGALLALVGWVVWCAGALLVAVEDAGAEPGVVSAPVPSCGG